MAQTLPALEAPNPTGSCWTCVERGLEEDCDKLLPCSLYAVSSLGLPPDEDRLLLHYAKNITRLSVAVDYDGNGYRHLVAVAMNDQALLNALLALSVSHLSRWQKKTDLAAKSYLRQSLQHLQRLLADPASARSETTMMTMLILFIFELCQGGDAWKHHYDGILAWTEARKAGSSSIDGFLTSAFAMSALQVLLHNPGNVRERSFHFFNSLGTLQSKDPSGIDVIIGYPLDLPQFIVEATRLHEDMRKAKLAGDEELLEAAYQRVMALKRRIRSSRTASNPTFGMLVTDGGHTASRTAVVGLTPANLLEDEPIREAARASAEIFRLALHIYVCRIVYDPMTTGQHQAEICDAVDRAFEYLPLVPDTVGPGTFLGWALVVIGAEIDALDRREHIKRRLRSLVLLALNQGSLSLRVLDEVWRRRDETAVGTSNNRRCRWQEVMEDLHVDLALI